MTPSDPFTQEMQSRKDLTPSPRDAVKKRFDPFRPLHPTQKSQKLYALDELLRQRRITAEEYDQRKRLLV
ncbi:MAG: hypothetical protein HY592_02135 [Candidatus Omnitrophica bacterium]|nr:hypothetical protein [Candidatus Omnitrophota bacterium]